MLSTRPCFALVAVTAVLLAGCSTEGLTPEEKASSETQQNPGTREADPADSMAGGMDRPAGTTDDSGDGMNQADGGMDAGMALPDGGTASPEPPMAGIEPQGDGNTVWRPAPGTTWQWQLTGDLDTSYEVEMYDVDLFDTPVSTIGELQARGIAVVCYFSAGSWENWRDDMKGLAFLDEVLGPTLDGWPDEKWLDISDSRVRAIMLARLDLASEKGCDAVEPDNVDGYENWPQGLSANEQLDYLGFLAEEAHKRGLSIGLKNDLAQVDQLVESFDWALSEECLLWDECELLRPFLDAGKAVFHVEYGPASIADDVCTDPTTEGFSSLVKKLDLDSWRVACD